MMQQRLLNTTNKIDARNRNDDMTLFVLASIVDRLTREGRQQILNDLVV